MILEMATSTSATAAISTRGLTKRYGSTLALDSLDLSILPGEVYGFLGPNGAGKTTTIRLLLGLQRPTAGQCVDTWVERDVGQVPHDHRDPPWVSAGRRDLRSLGSPGERFSGRCGCAALPPHRVAQPPGLPPGLAGRRRELGPPASPTS